MSVEYAVELKFQNHRLTWAELHILVERYMSASGHIGGFDRLAYDFSIALNVELGSFALTVDHGHHALALILTGYDIDTLVGDELSLTAFGNHFVALAPVEQVANPAEHIVFRLCSTFGSKRVVLV